MESLLTRLEAARPRGPLEAASTAVGPAPRAFADRRRGGLDRGETECRRRRPDPDRGPDLRRAGPDGLGGGRARTAGSAAIWALADAGAPAEAIARETGQPIGQVELILGLRRQLGRARRGAART